MPSKKRIVSRKKVSEALLKADAKRKGKVKPIIWGEDTGRRLHNFRRVHHFLVNNFPKEKLKGMKITHLGAGNGKYMDFLAR